MNRSGDRQQPARIARQFLALVGMGIVVVVVWMLFERQGMPSPQTSAELTEAVAGPRVAAGGEPPAVADAREPVTSPDAITASDTRAPAPDAAAFHEVQVVRFGTNEPVAGAALFSWPPDLAWNTLPREQQERIQADREGYVRSVSPQMISDAAGRCRVPVSQAVTEVLADKDRSFGRCLVLRGGPDPAVLALRPDHTLTVVVVDAAGLPAANVQVLARGAAPGGGDLGRTDASGRVEYRHVQELAGTAATRMLEVFARVPGGESPPVVVDAAAPPPIVTLHLPVAGTVVVHLRDAEGQPPDPTYLADPMVRLAWFTARPVDAPAEAAGLGWAASKAPIDGNGDATFVGVAFDGFVLAESGQGTRSLVEPGPTRAAPQRDLVITEGKDGAVLRGVLLAPGGVPLASVPFAVSLRGAVTRGKTDTEGGFRVAVARPPAEGPVGITFSCALRPSEPPLSATLAPRVVGRGRIDLGEVRLGELAVVIQGRLSGDLVPAKVRLPIERKDGDRWIPVSDLVTEWSGASAFLVRGGVPKGMPLRLHVHSDDLLPSPPFDFQAGDTNVVIPVRAGASLEATFLVDPAGPQNLLVVHLRPVEPPQPRDMEWRRMDKYEPLGPAVDGRVVREWGALRPGRYRLRALCAGVDQPIAEVDGIEVADGRCTDRRLQAIDLRGKVRTFEVRATWPDGSPVQSSEAFVVIFGTGERWNGFQLGSGVAKLASPGLVDLLVVADGCQVARSDGVLDSRTIQLVAAPESRVRVEFESPLPEGATVSLRFLPSIPIPRDAFLRCDTGRGGGAADFFTEKVVVRTEGVSLRFRVPGDYTIAAAVRIGGREAQLRAIEPGMATLPMDGELVIRVTAADLAAAIERTRR